MRYVWKRENGVAWVEDTLINQAVHAVNIDPAAPLNVPVAESDDPTDLISPTTILNNNEKNGKVFRDTYGQIVQVVNDQYKYINGDLYKRLGNGTSFVREASNVLPASVNAASKENYLPWIIGAGILIVLIVKKGK